ncbi:Telomerase Cajal body protein [Ooceraea biroi]|uniref:WD repeat-containing protein 79 n=1 Tax=Ooceraea biroi TaxID=2015173 RepID=A0A026WFU3_OOCBI|nr:Telomerase Cajal body protein [Ooceraea biroi]
MDCEKSTEVQNLSITIEQKMLNESTLKDESRLEDDNHVQPEDAFMQAEDSCNVANIETLSESDVAPITNKADSPIPSQSHMIGDATKEVPETSEEAQSEKEVKNTEPSNSEDIEPMSPPCIDYDWSASPRLLCTATKEYESTSMFENFTKGCQWSPDGTCLLVPSEDFRIRIYELPRELYSGKVPPDFMETNFTPAITVKEGGLVYDTCWYPFMNSWQPASCCFLSTSKESPAHLWDAFTGELRATYRPYNQMDEIEAAISVQFVDSGREIWCGFKNAVRIFDTSYPGRQTSTVEFKHDFPSMIGLVSCIRENPIMPGLVAVGTYSKCIGLYKDAPLCTFKTASGVTQVEFSSCGTKLFSACRKSGEFLCWDLRNPGDVLHSFEGRQSDTNQRIQFDVTCNGKWMISGGTDGNITVWELPDVTKYGENLNPKYKIKLSEDCINGTSLHKTLPILATSSGQRGIETEHKENSVKLWGVL